MLRYFFIAFLLVMVAVVSLAGFRGGKSALPPIEIFPDMDHQPKYQPQHPSGFFADGRSARKPVDGTVQQLNVSTVGQVVTSGQSLLTVVPLDGPIEVEVMLANKDIGFVKLGQTAIVKIEAFPFTESLF